MSKERIVIVVPTLLGGGLERAAINLAQFILSKEYKVDFFVLSGGKESTYPIPDGCSVTYGKKNIKNRLGFFFSLYRLRKYCITNKVNIILSFSGRHSSFVILSLLKVHTNIYVFHRSNPLTSYGVIFDLLNKLMYPKSNLLVVQTEKARNIFKEKFSKCNIFVSPNSVRNLPTYNIHEAENIIISVGRLSESKGFKDLIRIFSKTNAPEWKLIILGEGPQKNELEEYISERNLDGRVILAGFKKNIDEWLLKAKIFAFASKTEGFPNALLEAACLGLPSIAYDCPTGPSEIIKDGCNGYLIPLNDEITFQNKLQLMIDSENTRLHFSQESIKLRSTHSPDVVSDQLLNKILEVAQ